MSEWPRISPFTKRTAETPTSIYTTGTICLKVTERGTQEQQQPKELRGKKKGPQKPFNSCYDFSVTVVRSKTWQLVSGSLVSDDTTLVQTLPRLISPLRVSLLVCLVSLSLPGNTLSKHARKCARGFSNLSITRRREHVGVIIHLYLNTVIALFSYVAQGEDRVCVSGWWARNKEREEEREGRVNLKPKMAACS